MGFSGFRQIRDRFSASVRNESGQSIILISVVILSFLMFFSFAVNTGLLINAKISVQNAADAAAYAGAATQARQLNAISFLNYDMRRQYKKFIFRYSFIGSIGSAYFPTIHTGPATTSEYDFEKIDYSSTMNPDHVIGIQVPVVCIPLTGNGTANDNCRVVNLTNTAYGLAGGNSGVNPIQSTEIQGLLDIAAVQNKICQGQGQINLFTLISWLFRADLDDSQLVQAMTNLSVPLAQTAATGAGAAQTQQIIDAIKPLLGGLGLYPRNIISIMRAHTLEGFLNQKHETAITAESVDAWVKAPGADARERTIQAFRSAQSNLNSNVFDQNLLQMDEMQADNLITLGNITTNFNVYVQHMSPTSKQETVPVTSQLICQSEIDPFPAIGVPIGVTANLMKVNYGVHLKAFIKPHGLLYLPNSDALELDAYAGAKPFGARIGPTAAPTPKLTDNVKPAILNIDKIPHPINDCSDPIVKCSIPILDVGAKSTTYSTAYLADLVNTARGGNPTAPFTAAGITTALSHALAPSPEEIGRYNILPTPKAPGDTKYGDIKYDYINYSSDPLVYRFYAPITPDGSGDAGATVASYLDQIFAKTQIGTTSNPLGINTNDMRNELQKVITGYITGNLSAPSGPGVTPQTTEDGETTTFAAVRYPMTTDLKPGSQGFWLTQSNQVMSSWAPGQVSAITSGKTLPRFGYSVKFATLHELQKDGLGANEDDLDAVNH